MVQEVITYVIVAMATGIAVWKMYKELSGKKRKKMQDLKKQTFSDQHNCSDCVAECILRDSQVLKKSNSKLCEKTIQKIKGS